MRNAEQWRGRRPAKRSLPLLFRVEGSCQDDAAGDDLAGERVVLGEPLVPLGGGPREHLRGEAGGLEGGAP